MGGGNKSIKLGDEEQEKYRSKKKSIIIGESEV